VVPDPASRFQPEGPHGLSEVVDPDAFEWQDAGWRGVQLDGRAFYELHVGTFTPEGTWAAAATRLPHLRDLGVGIVELLPVADFPGRFGWGYDGVNWLAPTRLYGRPDDFRAFVDRAHQLGLGVVLDVVYNHLGPDGNYLAQFSDAYQAQAHGTPWGDALNFDGAGCEGLRTLVVSSAVHWIAEYHLDGFRFDATDDIRDASAEHVLALVARRAREAAGGRAIVLVAENDQQDVRLVGSAERGGYGLDAMWSDDFHHSVAASTGLRTQYLADFRGSVQELVSFARRGRLYAGQPSPYRRGRRGTPEAVPLPRRSIAFLENHDQVANPGLGHRLHERVTPGRLRALTALLLLMPSTPLLFQGQEWGATAPFHFFADHDEPLATAVRSGRLALLQPFVEAWPGGALLAPDPGAPDTWRRCCLDWTDARGPLLTLHRDLLALRSGDGALGGAEERAVEGAVLAAHAFALRETSREGAPGSRLLLVNLGGPLALLPASEPLLAPPAADWRVAWHSADARYGGPGGGWDPLTWTLAAECAVLLVGS
jgi:maltooligosyltrehalose trehalohydrolase